MLCYVILCYIMIHYIEVCTANIDKLAADIATQTSELNEATSVREKAPGELATVRHTSLYNEGAPK